MMNDLYGDGKPLLDNRHVLDPEQVEEIKNNDVVVEGDYMGMIDIYMTALDGTVYPVRAIEVHIQNDMVARICAILPEHQISTTKDY